MSLRVAEGSACATSGPGTQFLPPAPRLAAWGSSCGPATERDADAMIVRLMCEADLPALINLQQAGAILGMADVFPQDEHPFPRDTIVARWRDEIRSSDVDTYVATDGDGHLVGFAATTGSELLHFGTAVDTWGDGTAQELHEAVVRRLRANADRISLHVFAENRRARRFYEKLGWSPTGAIRTSGFAPYPLLLEYALDITA